MLEKYFLRLATGAACSCLRVFLRYASRQGALHIILKYAEEHLSEVLAAIDDKTDAMIRELEQKEREAARAMRQGPPRPPRYTPEQLAEVPF
jgi:diketogulonate reductase-like aldo/keto reductase